MLDSQTFADQVKYVSFLIRRVASIQILEGQIGTTMTPHWENTFFCSFQQLPRLRLGPLKGFMSCHHCGLQGPFCVASRTTEIQRHVQVWRTRRGGPRIPSRTTDTNPDCVFVENAPVFVVPSIRGARPPLTNPLIKLDISLPTG